MKRIKRYNLFFIVFTFCIFNANTQNLTKKEIVEDLNILVNSIIKYNPALEIYNLDFQSKSQDIITDIKGDLSLLDYFKKVSEICTLSNEGHFGLGNWEDNIHKGILNSSYSYLPFTVRIIANKIYIKKSYTNEFYFNEFDEILSINGKTSGEILKKLFTYIPSDGNINSYQTERAAQGFFWMYYFYVEQPETFEISYKSIQDNEVKNITINALTRSQQIENLKNKTDKEKTKTTSPSINDFYELNFHDTHAYIKLKSFNRKLIEKYDIDEKKFYQKIFEELEEKNINNLIIDIRNNTGGRNEFADEIVPFILQTSPDDFLKKTISWKGKVKTYKFPKKNDHVFEGKIYVLVNGLTYSAGGTLARYLKEYGNTTTIGEETGTRYEGFVAGSSEYIDLPNSKITIGIPRYHIQFPISKKQKTSNRGLLPDVEVSTSVLDIKNKKDAVLEKALELILKK